jgi:hypothetical protein
MINIRKWRYKVKPFELTIDCKQLIKQSVLIRSEIIKICTIETQYQKSIFNPWPFEKCRKMFLTSRIVDELE